LQQRAWCDLDRHPRKQQLTQTLQHFPEEKLGLHARW
jgi:hypothetical protein